MSISSSIGILRDWMQQNDVHLDPRLMLVEHQGGVGVIALSDLSSVGSTVASIPKSAMISLRVCSIYHWVKHLHVLHGHEAQLGLALALHVEMLRGRTSRWWEYIQSLPQKLSLPVLWASNDDDDSRQARYWASGTHIQHEMNSGIDLETISEWWRKNVRDLSGPDVLNEHHYMTGTTLEAFHHAYALVSSRAFMVDAYHGLSMVPLADAFNHTSGNHVQMQADFDVCIDCGALDECPHDEMDSINTVKKVDTAESTNKTNTCDMELVAAVPAGAEVFNTYGDGLSNAELMCRYGFILDDNEHDVVSWAQTSLKTSELNLMVGRTEQHQRFFDMMQRVVPSVPQWDESELVYNPVRRPAHFRPCLSVNADGSLSHDLWLWASTLVLTQHELVAEDEAAFVLVAMSDICLEIEHGADDWVEIDGLYKMVTSSHGRTKEHHRYVHTTFTILCDIIEQRLSLIGRGHTADAIGNVLDNISMDQQCTRMVLAQVLAELSMLEACQARLKALLDSSG